MMLQSYKTHASRLIAQADIAGYAGQWADLSKRAVENNGYFSPQYGMALLETVCAGDDVEFITAWKGEKLTGLLPVTKNRIPIRGVRTFGQSWRSIYTFSGMPLLDREEPEQAAFALVQELAEMGGHDWMLKDVYPEGHAFLAMAEALESSGFAWTSIREFQRASFSRDHDFEDHMQNHVPAKRRRDLGRNRRRIEKLGELSHQAHVDGPGLEAAVETFLEMEASGWKGERGTALACQPDTKEFARKAFKTGEYGKTRIDLLLLDGKPIATGVIIFGGDTAFTIKGAYDEEYANYSAGLLLELEVAKSFLEDGWADRLDSATAGDHVIDFLWPEKRTVADIVFSCSNQRSAADLKGYQRSDEAYRSAKNFAKRVLKR